MTTDGFYRLRDSDLFYAPDSVGSLDYDLHRDLHHTYEYPVDGWRWFDSETDARTFYGMAKLEAPEERVGPDYEGFYNSFLNSASYQTILYPALLQPGSDVLGNAMTWVGFAIQDALAARIPLPTPGNPNSLQAAIWGFMSVAPNYLTPENLVEIQTLLVTYGMSSYYTLVPPTQ